MEKKERVRAALAGQPVDRVPAAFWGHDYLREWSARGLADAMLEPFHRYDWDYMKVNPRATYYAEAWGNVFEPSGDPARGPATKSFLLHDAADLAKVRPLSGVAGPFAEQLEALRLIGEGIDGAYYIQTLFSPLSVIGRLAGGDLAAVRRWMTSAPEALKSALAAVAATLSEYAAASLQAGAAGVFFATTDWATADHLDPALYAEFARPFDLQVLASVRDASFNVLHVCRPRNFLPELLDYPVSAFNWADREEGNLSLAAAAARTPAAVMGGVAQRTIARGSPEEVAAEVREAIASTGGRRLLVAPGCSISPQTPPENLAAAAAARRA
jgi:uroporphyrinogen decarboxylase